MKNCFKVAFLLMCAAQVLLSAVEPQVTEGYDMNKVIVCKRCRGRR